MRIMTRLFAPSAMHSQQAVAERAVRVIDHVIFDLGVDRLVQGTVALDARLRPHFFPAQPGPAYQVLACVQLAQLAESRGFDTHAHAPAGAPLREPVAALVEGLLREFRVPSPRFRALPP